MTGCTLSSGQREGVGASRRIEQRGRAAMQETVVEWHDGSGFVLELHEPGGDKAPLPFAQARFAYRIVEADARSTDAELSLSYTLRGGALGQAVDALLLRAAMQKQVEAVASAMKLFYETEA